MAATSFGHLTTSDTIPPVVGYQPITGTIFDQLDNFLQAAGQTLAGGGLKLLFSGTCSSFGILAFTTIPRRNWHWIERNAHATKWLPISP